MEDSARTAILKTGLQLFARKGIRGTELDDIGQTAGISRKEMHALFTNKGQFIEEAVRSEIESSRTFAKQVVAGSKNPVEKLREIYSYGLDLAPVFHPIFMFTLQKYYPAVNKICDRFGNEYFREYVREIIREGIEEGLFQPLDLDFTVRVQQACFNAVFESYNKLADTAGPKSAHENILHQLIAGLAV